MNSDWQAATCWHLLLERMNSVGVMLMVPSSSGCLISKTGEAGEATSLCMESMHISDMQQLASAAEWAARSHPHCHARCLLAQQRRCSCLSVWGSGLLRHLCYNAAHWCICEQRPADLHCGCAYTRALQVRPTMSGQAFVARVHVTGAARASCLPSCCTNHWGRWLNFRGLQGLWAG